eukprot:TRINITY_DN2814_c0_g1_i1.p1 TRINITY_DN2814_c0_g1~~TRINITY_DN2814_c0_g1_i1.p1  ORF type:complete len:517 (+),score=176.12 TRINITY_DN2814_c0_g1_i1:144-1553(+)
MSQSPDAMDRAAAVHSVSFALSGAREAPSGWSVPLARALGDNTVWVRQASCEGIAQLAESLRPSDAVAEGLLLLLRSLSELLPREPQPELLEKAAAAMTSILRELSTDEAASSLGTVAPALLQAFTSSSNGMSAAAASAAASGGGAEAASAASAAAAAVAAVATALGALAAQSADHFEPIAGEAAKTLLNLLKAGAPGIGASKGGMTPAVLAACIDAAGAVVASAWSEPSFHSAREELAGFARAVLVSPGAPSEARASSHNFFKGVALASFEEFAPSLSLVVPPAVDVLMAADEAEVSRSGRRRAVRTGTHEERVAATEALGAYAAAVGGARFAPQLAAVLPAVCAQAQHASSDVRAAAGNSLGQIGRALGDLAEGLPEGHSDRPAAAAMAQAAAKAVCELIQAKGLEGSDALRSALQAKEDLEDCAGFMSLAGQGAACAFAEAAGGRRSEDVESSDDEDEELAEAEED